MAHRFLLLFVSLVLVQTVQAYPSRFRLIWNDDPATTMTIGWDQAGNTSPFVWVAESKASLETPDGFKCLKQYPDRKVYTKGMHNTFVRLKGLKPNTAYYFRVQDGDGLAPIFWFKTAPSDNKTRLSFIAGGDSRTFREPRRQANQMVSKLRPTGVFFAGDMTGHGTEEQWINWFDDWQSTISTDGRMYPVIVARGNHEHTNREVWKLFDTPCNKIYYSLRFGTDLLHFYTLNSQGRKNGPQTRWLKKSLIANQDATWHVAQYHHPVRPHIKRKPEGKAQYSLWVPLFEKYGLKLAIESDSHTHKITWPLLKDESGEEGFVRNDEKGITYVGEGCWGAPLQVNDDNKSWTRHSGRIPQVKWIFVDQSRIEVRTVLYDNVAEVASVSDEDVFTPPQNLKVQNLGDSDVAVILKN